MSVTLTGSGGLFTRLGRIGKLIYLVNVHQGALPAAFESLLVQYDATTPPGLRDVAASLPGLQQSVIRTPAAWLGAVLGRMARDTLLRQVALDNRGAGRSVGDALRYLVRQMVADSDSIKAATVGATATAFDAGNTGDGVVVVSALTGSGDPEELILPESLVVSCTTSSYAGTATAGQERFRALGGTPAPDRLGYDWPNGSGADVSLRATAPAGSDDKLRNGSFESFTTANTPDYWVIDTGAAGTDVLSEGTTVYSGDACVELVGDGSTTVTLSQTFGDSAAGTSSTLASLTPYAFSLRYRQDVTPAAGVLTAEITDASGTVIADPAGTNNRLQVDLTAKADDTWFDLSGVFRMPDGYSAGQYKLRVRFSTAVSSGTSVFVDHLCLAPMTRLYAGGPWAKVLAGGTPFAVGDGWTVAVTNDRGGSSDNATWHALLDRLFGLRELGVRLPTDASPTVADSLITS